MATSVIMPALELAQETGKVIRWLKAPGDAVAKVLELTGIALSQMGFYEPGASYEPAEAFGPGIIRISRACGTAHLIESIGGLLQQDLQLR